MNVALVWILGLTVPGVLAGSAHAAPAEVVVEARLGWQPAEVELRAGQSFAVTHRSGSWTVGDPGLARVGPAGYSAAADREIFQGCKILADHVYGQLLARIGDSQPFVVARSGTYAAPAAGRLEFRIHDDDRCLVDNAGALRMAVEAEGGSPGGGEPGNGAVLYSANWSSGLNGWAGGASWKPLRGALLNDASSSTAVILAPYDTGVVTDYAVEARIRVTRMGNSFGLLARRTSNGGGYSGSDNDHHDTEIRYGAAGGELVDRGQPFDPGDGWHTYRLEVDGNVIRFLIDGAVHASGADNRYLDGGVAGIYSDWSQLEISSFTISRLH